MSRSPLPARSGSRGGRLRAASALVAGATLLSAGLAVAAPANAADTSFVPDSAISSTRATTHGWYAEENSGGQVGVSPAFDGSAALEMSIPSPAASTRALFTYGPSERPSSLADIVSGASYVYSGLNVNFQLEFFFRPVNPAYGPTAGVADKCTAASDDGVPIADWCYGVIKYEPGATSVDTWTTVTLGDKDTGWKGVTQPGWWPTNRIGAIPKNAFDTTFTSMLAEIAEVKVIGVGVAAGSGSSDPQSAWVRSVSYGGASYRFGDAPVPAAEPVEPPAASTDALEDFIADAGIDVAATTETFSVGDAAPGEDVELDPTAPLDASLPWAPVGDDFVDLYAYSEPLFLGTFPVVDGAVVVTGLDVSALEAGGHHLVFIGQTTQEVSVVRIAVQEAPAPSDDPGDEPSDGPGTPSDEPSSSSTPAPSSSTGTAGGGSAGGTSNGALASTGVDPLPLGVLALIALAIGAGVMLNVRTARRQQRS
ncbi:hypothetical protein [Compostimonas suwonensis]|uniref:LPXTG-motif cell wall-anchored protein n=1 Tax=Compostimonas suwonensis TaxID=1048394 RepID=A0A2M9C553_9MICO|nr:hypothetical protein [Compostimonas suwonensis]PJJ65660.1 hypothetical protein CLV54_0697 [Compostimonas suwonensis]